MGWGDFFEDAYKKGKKSVKDAFSDPGKGLLAIGTGGASLALEVAAESLGEAGSRIQESVMPQVPMEEPLPMEDTSPLDMDKERKRVREEERQRARGIASRTPGRSQTVLTSSSQMKSLLG